MQHLDPSPPSVVIGIDGSRAAVGAAVWAADEAAGRNVPLRLVYAIEPSDEAYVDAQVRAHQLATAELAFVLDDEKHLGGHGYGQDLSCR